MQDHIVILSACGSEGEAEAIAHSLVEQRLAACVNIAAPSRSLYRWRGKVESAVEWVLLIKTSRLKFADVETAILAIHSYEVPEILALPVVTGSEVYLKWIGESLHE